MDRQSVRNLVMTLYGASDPQSRINALTQIVIDLLVEVEALRGALIQLEPCAAQSKVHQGYDIPCHDDALTQGKGVYATSYVDAAYTLHNSAGPSSGLEKLLARFYPVDGAGPRESAMLRRLGFTRAEIVQFLEAADEAEMFT